MAGELRKAFQRAARMRGVEEAWEDIEAEMGRLKEMNDYLVKKTYCAYCGDEFPLDTVTADQVGEHIRTCPKHPMRAVEKERDTALARLPAVREKVSKMYENLGRSTGDTEDAVARTVLAQVLDVIDGKKP